MSLHHLYHAHGPETSREAVESIEDQLGPIQQEVLKAFEEAGENGLADFQLADIYPHRAYSTYRSRRVELMQKGILVDTGRRIVNLGNRRHVVWALAKFYPDIVPTDAGGRHRTRDETTALTGVEDALKILCQASSIRFDRAIRLTPMESTLVLEMLQLAKTALRGGKAS